MAEELSWKYDARKGCEKAITLGAYSLVISKWHVYHVFEQDWLRRGLIFKKVSWMGSLKFRILGEPKIAVYLRYKKGVIIPGGKKTTSPHFMLLTNYASFSVHESIISTLCIGSSSPVVAPQLIWTFFRRKKLLCLPLHWDLFALNVTEEESDKIWITRIQFGRKSPWRCPQSTSDFIMSR